MAHSNLGKVQGKNWAGMSSVALARGSPASSDLVHSLHSLRWGTRPVAGDTHSVAEKGRNLEEV